MTDLQEATTRHAIAVAKYAQQRDRDNERLSVANTAACEALLRSAWFVMDARDALLRVAAEMPASAH